ncbi:MAG: DsrE family protein [Anaerolineae bacterium]
MRKNVCETLIERNVTYTLEVGGRLVVENVPARVCEETGERDTICCGWPTSNDNIYPIWGATAQLVSENDTIQALIRQAQEVGVTVTACKACADQLGVTEDLEALGIDVQYLGIALTNLLKSDEALLTV